MRTQSRCDVDIDFVHTMQSRMANSDAKRVGGLYHPGKGWRMSTRPAAPGTQKSYRKAIFCGPLHIDREEG